MSVASFTSDDLSWGTIFLPYNTEVFPHQNIPKTLDLSCKMDLEFWDRLGEKSFQYLNYTQLFHIFGVLYAELLIRGGIEDNSKIIFLISQQKHCDPSIIKSFSAGRSDDRSQHIF